MRKIFYITNLISLFFILRTFGRFWLLHRLVDFDSVRSGKTSMEIANKIQSIAVGDILVVLMLSTIAFIFNVVYLAQLHKKRRG